MDCPLVLDSKIYRVAAKLNQQPPPKGTRYASEKNYLFRGKL